MTLKRRRTRKIGEEQNSNSLTAKRMKLKLKTYEKELAKLHAELVKLQQWVAA